MASPSVWFQNNDMILTLVGLRTSTMSSTTWLNGSTNLLCNVWKADSTAASTNHVVTNQTVAYVGGTNGNYRTTVQSTQHTMQAGQVGMAILTLNHLGLNAEWRAAFHVERRATT